ncbi:hypothetical protein RJ639_041044 [Escallonia herrerae]|uniref:Uncharacterized protein n=1 Tax=Escallonia herrerae TaxID=1293975 RepID=A0AA88WD32_9ASTE|nr:hypothetical protein RJ639_041044 [Escallonia herrerae]
MKCLHCHRPLTPLFSRLNYKQKMKGVGLLWLSTTEPAALLQRRNISSPAPGRTKAITSSLVLGASPTAATGDLSVLLQTSALLLFAYWIANFVVPDIIAKDLQLDKSGEEQKPVDEDAPINKEESTAESSTRSSTRKKRDFNSTKF